jgi:hypothetical protein
VLLDDASALVRSYTRQQFEHIDGDELVLRPVGTILRLPQRPVTAVTQVIALGGEVVPDLVLPVGTWTWDGLDKVDVWPPDSTWILNLPEIWTDLGWPVNTYRVTYSHGYATIPPDVVAVVCGMVGRVLLSPSPVEGMVSERVGQYMYQMQQGTGATGAAVRLTDADRDALAAYRRTAGTIQVVST